ncbi:unnamed protein product [Cochlearia groenlandica]
MSFVKSLGKGSYGSVNLYSYTNHDGSTIYNAVKISDQYGHESLEREFRVLSELKGCPNIVQCFGNALLQGNDCNGNKVYKLRMEYASGDTLTSFIRINRKISDSVIKDFTRMILQGLVSIHSRGYVHCDLKPENILLFIRYDEETWNCSYELKISDFGLSIKTGDKSCCWKTHSPFVGTPIYMSPESVKDGSVEETLDLWSLGCVVLEMYRGKHQWLEIDLSDLTTYLLSGNGPEIPENVPCDARQFIEKCFARNPKERGSALELLSHPFLTGERRMACGGGGGGERRRIGLRIRKAPERFEDITKKPSRLKIISSKSSQFKKVAIKPLKLKILPPKPPKSSFVPA